MRLFLLLFALLFSLSAEEDFGYSDTPEVTQNILYCSYESVPDKVFKGQIFPITIKTLSTESYFQEIAYHFQDGRGLELLNEKPLTRHENHYYYHTFYFLATHDNIKTPNITVSLVYSEYIKDDLAYLSPLNISVVKLNPPKNYVNIIANDFRLTQYKTNHYDDEHNIAVFSTEADYAFIEAFVIPGGYKQGFESNSSTIEESKMTYYAIIPKHLEQLEFIYFNLLSHRFEKLIMPIVIDDDSVSTQSNLKPKDHRHTQIKLYIAIGFALVSLLLFIMRRRYFYLFLFLGATVYAGYISVPIQNACVKKGSSIYLLPMQNGTVFETTQARKVFQIEGSIDGYIKVKLHNNKIGWIRNEALCTP
jgi:hypothetical protein